MIANAASSHAIEGFWTRHQERINLSLLVVGVALCAIAIGVLIGISHTDGVLPTDKISPLASYARSFQVYYFAIMPIGLALTFAGCVRIRNSKKTSALTKTRRTLLILGGSIALLAIMMITVASTILHSKAFSDPTNASCYADKNTLANFTSQLNTTIASGSITLIVGVSIAAVGAFTSIPKKIASIIEARRQAAAERNAKADLENPTI